MKPFVKHIVSALSLGLCLLSCSKDPETPIYTTLDFKQCLRPVSFSCSVEYVKVTVKFNTFPDAEAYQVEAYSTDFLSLPEGEEPAEEDRVFQALITAEDVPYTFIAPEEITCHIRVRSVNETAGRRPSEWVTGRVKTDVDPATRCATPDDFKAKANYNWVTCSLTPMSNCRQYYIELYSKAIPATGDPNPEDLISSITKLPEEFPFTIKDVPAGTYYYRIQGQNEEDGLRPSKWVKGSFTTQDYSWLDVEGSFDYGLASGAKRTTKFVKADITAELNAQFGKKAVGADLTCRYVWDGVTYGPTCSYSDDKWGINRCKNFDSKTYAKPLPQEAFEMIEICQPGTVSFIPRANSNDQAKMPEIVYALLATRGSEKTLEYIYQQPLAWASNINTKQEANRLSVEVTEEHLYGITEPAQLYLFTNLQGLIIYPLDYTRK